MNIISRPYNLLGLAGVLVILLSFFLADHTIDLHIYDTYYLIASSFLFTGIAILLMFFWIIYRAADQVLYSKILTWVHVIVTLLALLFILIAASQMYAFNEPKYNSWTTINKFRSVNKLIMLASLVFGISQLLFAINIVGGMIKGRTLV